MCQKAQSKRNTHCLRIKCVLQAHHENIAYYVRIKGVLGKYASAHLQQSDGQKVSVKVLTNITVAERFATFRCYCLMPVHARGGLTYFQSTLYPFRSRYGVACMQHLQQIAIGVWLLSTYLPRAARFNGYAPVSKIPSDTRT